MKLKQATIYGFGKWVDYTIDFTGNSFMAIYGQNESGKSSIQRFILFMLFGLPPKQRDFYRPKTSSKMGGRLTVEDASIGEFTIERFDEKLNGAAICYSNNGEHNEDWLKEQLAGIDRKTFESIFTFSALDLNGIQTMKEEEIGEVLFSIGLTGSTQIYTLEKRLDQQTDELFRARGKKPTINAHLKKLNEAHAHLTYLKSNEETYENKQSTKKEVQLKIKEIQKKIKSSKEQLILLEKKRQALPTIYDYLSYEKQLEALTNNREFPEDGIHRLQALKEIIIPMKSEQSILQINEDKYMKQMEEHNQLLAKSIPYEEALSLQNDYESYREKQAEKNRLTDSIDKIERQMDSELQNINIGITERQLSQLELPFHMEQSWNVLKKKKEQLALDEERFLEEKQILKNKQTRVESELQKIESKLLTTEQRQKLQEKLDMYNEHKIVEKHQQERINKETQWENRKSTIHKKAKQFFVVSLAVTIIFAMLGFVLELPVLTTISIFSIMIGIAQLLWNNNSIKNMDQLFKQQPKMETPTNLSKQEKEEMEKTLRIDDQFHNEQISLLEQKRNNEFQKVQLDEKQSILQQKNNNFQQMLAEQWSDYPFLQPLDVSYWPELYHNLKALIRMSDEKESLLKQLDTTNEQLHEFTNHLKSFFVKNNYGEEVETVDEQMDWVKKELSIIRKTKDAISQLKEYIVENRTQQEQVMEKRRVYEDEVSVLLHAAGVKTEEEFYVEANNDQKRQELLAECQKIKKQFSGYFNTEEWESLIKHPPKESSLELQLTETEQDIKDLENQLEGRRLELADLQVKLDNMESSDDYSKALHQFEIDQEQLKELAKQWAVLQTAKKVLVETKNSYRDKYLSKVMDLTSNYFNHLTDGAYKDVYPPMDRTLFTVETKSGIRYTVNELSQGTINQLYVSLRLAISEIMSKEYRLPFIIDDAFVHFDYNRTELVVDLLKQIAKKNQILLFTCKTDLMKHFHEQTSIKLSSTVSIM